MNWKYALALVLLSILPISSAHADICANKDLINLGPATAYDIAVVLRGIHNLTWRYDGYSDLRFHNFNRSVNTFGNTILHWQNGNGVDAPIPPGKLIHVGWCTAREHNVANMYWTDRNGNRIPGSVVYNMINGRIYLNGRLVLRFTNEFENRATLTISDLAIARISAELPLEQLNRQNQALASLFEPVPGGTSFAVAPGQTIELPVDGVAPNQTVVLRYAVSGPGSNAQALDFVQFPALSTQ